MKCDSEKRLVQEAVQVSAVSFAPLDSESETAPSASSVASRVNVEKCRDSRRKSKPPLYESPALTIELQARMLDFKRPQKHIAQQ